MHPHPSPRSNVRLAVALIWGALCIIWPIIRAEGVVAVFAPALAGRPHVDRTTLRRTFSSAKLAGMSPPGSAAASRPASPGAVGAIRSLAA